MLKGYNNMNTNVPNTFATDGKIVLSGAGRKAVYEGAGVMDDIKKGYNKTKSAVKSETGQKIVKALKQDKDVMKEFAKAKQQLDDYTSGVRKSKPGKLMLNILEKHGVISKIEDEFKGGGNASGKISRIKKAKKWTGFADDTLRKGIDTAAYGYKSYKTATNPITAKITSMFGGAVKRPPSNWIMHVKAFSQKNNISYKQALKEASPSYKSMKAKN
jgi:hypothetical protein